MSDVGAPIAAGRHVEAPGTDAFIPVGKNKCHVGTGARRDEVGFAIVSAAARQRFEFRQFGVDARDARFVAASLPVGLPRAIAHADLRIRHGFAVGETSYPNE